MSQEAKGLSPFAGGLGVPEAWCTAVATYGPADAAANGRTIMRAGAPTAARGMPGDLLSTWDQSLIVRHASGLAVLSRLLMLDKRGTGLSDRVREAPTLETRMDDVRAVMDAAGSERAVLWSGHEGSRTALLFAATYPERTAGLVLLEPSVRGTG